MFIPRHHSRRWLTCWVRWTFRLWPAQTGPWWWGSGIQTPHSQCSWTWGCPQYTAWNVSAERGRQELVSEYVCLHVCQQDVTGTSATCFDGAQIWWGNSCRTLASFPPCVQSNHMGLTSFSISVSCWDRPTLQCLTAGNVKKAVRGI